MVFCAAFDSARLKRVYASSMATPGRGMSAMVFSYLHCEFVPISLTDGEQSLQSATGVLK